MAIFASTTTSGYSDPLKAMNIKALEARLKDQQAQMAAEKPDAAMMATIPGGIGHVLGVVGDKMNQARSEQALAANRAELAKAMTGYDMNSGAPPPPIVASLNPELYKDLMQTWAENRRAAATDLTQRRGQDTQLEATQGTNRTTLETNQRTVDATLSGQANQAAMETARLEAAKKAAEEKVRTDEIAAGQLDTATRARDAQKVLDEQVAKAEAARVAEIAKGQEDTAIRARDAQKALDLAVEKRAEEDAKEKAKIAEFERNKTLPQNDLEKLTQSLGRKPTEEEVKAAVNKLTSKPPSEEKLIIEERNKAVEYQSTLKQLDKAHELISSPEGIHSGSAIGTPLKTAIGSVIPQSLGGPDDKKQANTLQFNNIMKSQGLQDLLKMKGASSDTDVKLNLEIANDVKQPLERRKEALAFVRDRMYTHVKANEEDVKRIGGDYPRLQSASGSDPNAAARAWLNNPANKDNPDYEAVRRKVEGK